MTWLDWLISLFRPRPRPTPAPGPAPQPDGSLIARINAERAAHGLAPLMADPMLIALARDWAATMHRVGVLDHGDFEGRFKAAFPDRSGEENIAWGQQSAAAVVDAWMNEAPDKFGRRGHRENILNHRMNRAGVGRSGNYWDVVFSS